MYMDQRKEKKMKKEKMKKVVGVVAAILVLVLLLPAFTETAAAPAWQPPKKLLIGSGGTKTSNYATCVALGSGITDATGIQVFVKPSATTLGRISFIHDKITPFTSVTAAGFYLAIAGKFEFEKWGPQKIRVVWNGSTLPQGVLTRGNSGIKTWADVKGKKVPQYVGYPMVQMYIDSALSYGNVSKNDVTQVPVGGYAPAIQAVINGTVDVAPAATTSGAARELEASVHGIHWLPMPSANTEAWARFRKVCPALHPHKGTIGAGMSAANPAEVWGNNLIFTAYDYQDEQLVYWLVKQVHQSFDLYKDKHSQLKNWTIDQCLDLEQIWAPFHPGSIKYFKEIGRWTDKHEKLQQSLLKKWGSKK